MLMTHLQDALLILLSFRKVCIYTNNAEGNK